jgi:hypothetical protein
MEDPFIREHIEGKVYVWFKQLMIVLPCNICYDHLRDIVG